MVDPGLAQRLLKQASLLVTLIASACSPLSLLATPTSTATLPPRSAHVSELRHQVDTRPRASAEWRAATEGETFDVGGGARTGTEARARVDISDGTILRLASNTEFSLVALSPESVDPLTRWVLNSGKIWVQVTQALGQGTFEIETPAGVATVRGSLMSVEHFPANGHTIVACLEGQCRLTGQSGAFTDLTTGEQAEIPGFGQDPTAPQPIDTAQMSAWAGEFPEASGLITTLTPGPPPTPTPSPTPTLTATPTPTALPTPTPTATATPIAVVGVWQGTTSQGWTLEFEVTVDGRIANLRITFPDRTVPCSPSGFLDSVRLSETTTLPIVDNRFTQVTWGLEGEFTTAQQVSGVINYTHPDCAISNPGGTWEATGP
jgi:hypothetical protein